MKKIGVITTNKVLAQSLAKSVRGQSELAIEFYPLLNLHQAILDADVLNINVALVDVMSDSIKASVPKFCNLLRQTVAGCKILLLVSQDDMAGREMAITATKGELADDFVFYDTSLDYLLAKLTAI